jgi:hypothetical protein
MPIFISRVKRVSALLATTAAAIGLGATAAQAAALPVQASCKLQSAGNKIEHVVYLQFDNVHLTRDNPNVPSEIEQMPNLLNFFQQKGSIMSASHTQLISHTALGFTSALTGLYGDGLGIPVANSYVLYRENGQPTIFPSAFTYWTSLVNDSTGFDTNFNMVGPNGLNAPAPWVTFTRAGCDFGSVAFANTELENVSTTARGDITNVFGSGSPEFIEAKANSTLAAADFEGLVIHCAQGSTLCGTSPNAHADVLPDEPGGYVGFEALYGNKYIAPQITPTKTNVVLDLNGQPITNSKGTPGFPGFDGTPAQVLGYGAAMLEAGVPVVYFSLTDLHDNHTTESPDTFGPGEAGAVSQLAVANEAFGVFFQRLEADGITPENTLFILTQDEGDHFSGAQQNNCDGVTTPCTYIHSGPDQNIGELDADLNSLVQTQFDDPLASGPNMFQYHFDSAPTIDVVGTPGPVLPAQNSAPVRNLERHVGALTATNLITGATDTLTQSMVDHAAMSTLHMITADPLRTPTFIMFANPDYFFESGDTTVSCIPQSKCITFDDGFAWNHGDIQEDIAHVQLGFVGPGVLKRGLDPVTWSDHTDVRPTIMALLGLEDDYTVQGRVLVEALNPDALPNSLQQSLTAFVPLAQAFKRINAPFQDFSLAMVQLSTKGMLSGSSANDALYAQTQAQITNFNAQRDALVAQMKPLLNNAAFGNTPFNQRQSLSLILQADLLALDAIDAAGGRVVPE